MTGELQQLLDQTSSEGEPGEWHGYCPVHDDRGGNPSLDIDVKAKATDCFEGAAYPRLYVRCRSCGANGVDVANALGLSFSDLQDDATSVELPPRSKRPWRIPTSAQVNEWADARRSNAEATRWLVVDRLVTLDTLDRLRIGWDEQRKRWTFPLLATSGCFEEPVPIGCLWYPAEPLSDGRRKMCNWGGAPPALYPDVPDSSVVLLVEGELDALVGRSRGLPTVSGTMGAGEWDDRLSAQLVGRWVVVSYDCDDAGRTGAADRVRDLDAAGVAARLHDLDPDRIDGFDLTDWFRAGRTAERLRSDLERSRTLGRQPRVPKPRPSTPHEQNGR